MKAIFIKTQGDYLEATLLIDGQPLVVMDEFGGSDLTAGDTVDICLSAGLCGDGEDQNAMLVNNSERERKLVQLNGWSYRAFGVVVDIEDETLVDVGVSLLEAPFDTRITGEYIAFTVERLDAHLMP
uniref:hypothetical protein n=1 Tax=Thaumasiovibrio occultus TaxID=1891184 RepID=UPI000B35D063|nr:hypothetical protein [Thaumasiovibrio occultus]